MDSFSSSIGVFCGSSHGNNPEYKLAAIALGEELAARKISLICGGGRSGLTGLIVDSCVASGGKAIGVMPESFVESERPSPKLTQLFIVESIDERKAKIIELSDALIAMPGGVGTLDEFLYAFALFKIGLLRKPIALLNVCGYYQEFEYLFQKMISNGFVKEKYRESLILESDIKKLLRRIFEFK